MARVTRFVSITPDRETVHRTEVECGWKIIDVDDRRFLQLDTYGSKSRKLEGKTSQTMQFDRSAAAELAELLRRAFPEIR